MEKSFLIYGGDLINKGAQAMTYITVYEIRKRFPEAKVTLLSGKDAQRKDLDKDNLLFDVRAMSLQTILYHLGGVYRILAKLVSALKHKSPDRELKDLLDSSAYMINISGFALSSKWGFVGSMSYLLSIKLMKKYGVKVVLMPQSFGPFHFGGVKGFIFGCFAKKYLRYPEHIFAREDDGYRCLVNEFHLQNVSVSPDLVLQNKEVDYGCVLRNANIRLPAIPDESVAIVPNIRSIENAKVQLVGIYQKIIGYYLQKGISVTILAHSNEDNNVCRELKSCFEENPNVVYIDRELACYEYEALARQFRYVLAARFHSIVHAYKEGVPCIALGWAVKYRDLMKLFGQEEYAIDVEALENEEKLIELMEKMDENLECNRDLIRRRLSEIQRDNCFSILEGS